MKKLLLLATVLTSVSSFAQTSEDVTAAVLYTKIEATKLAQKELYPGEDLCGKLENVHKSGELTDQEVIQKTDMTLDYICN